MPSEVPERVAVLESNVGHIREDIAGIRSDVKELRGDIKDIRGDVTALKVSVGTIQENIRHLPTIGASLVMLGTLIAIVVGVAGLAPKIQSWFGTAADPSPTKAETAPMPASPDPSKAETAPATPPAVPVTPAAAFLSVKFKSSTTEPTDAAKAELARVAADIKRRGGATPKMQLFYAATENNGGLADARAQAVEKYLKALGVTADFSKTKIADGAEVKDQLQMLAVPGK